MRPDITLASPHPDLRPCINFYYRLRQNYFINDDHLRADTGHFRFFLRGGIGRIEWPDGHHAPCGGIMLIGPINESPRIRVNGPLDLIGFSIRPEAWGQLIHRDASKLTDQAFEISYLFDRSGGAKELREAMIAAPDMRSVADLLDPILLPALKPLPERHDAIIAAIRVWLMDRMFPDVDQLYATVDISPRQVMRIANRYFGAPPKLLARKYGALRTASAMLAASGRPPAEALEHYADQSHMIREIRQFTGQTPRQLMTVSSPIMRESLSHLNFGEITPQA